MNTEILNVVAPTLIIAGLGYLLEVRGHGFHAASLSRLVMLLGTPSIVFSALTRTELPADNLVRLMVCALAVLLVGGVIAAIMLILARLPLRPFLPPLAMPNAGNAGLPIVLFAFEDEGLAIGVSIFFTVALFQYLVTPAVMVGRFSARVVLRQPLVWSVLAVLVFKLTGAEPPRVVMETTGILGGMMVPVMLVLLGGALARLKVRDFGPSLALAVARLAIGVTAGLTVIAISGLEGVEAAGLFIIASMPAGLITYVFAEQYGQEPERVAGLVVSSTVLTFALLPVIVIVALRIAGMG